MYMFYSLILYFSFLLFSSAPAFANQDIIFDESPVQSATILQNENFDNTINQESKEYSYEREKKIISSLVVAFIIVIVTLTPKLLLIYSATKKSKKSKLIENSNMFKGQEVNPIQDVRFDELRELVIKNDPLFYIKFRSVYPNIIHNILEKHPGLIKSELTLCAMIYLNFSAKEIAEFTFIQHRSVQTNRSRLRKKMNLSSDYNLDHYIRSFNH